MSSQEIQRNKLQLIQWITEIEDSKLLDKLIEFQSKNIDIPQWQKDIVLDRIKSAEPEDYISWSDAKKNLAK